MRGVKPLQKQLRSRRESWATDLLSYTDKVFSVSYQEVMSEYWTYTPLPALRELLIFLLLLIL